ncbi:MAG TPA: hypothetical protein VMY37_31120 [Thermoguttaceae bacterium]|nr:hypothetical protein [Thermoguttaceae bacterium]
MKRFFQSMGGRPAVAVPEAAVAVEETIAHRPEEETHGGAAGKAATTARRKTLILVSIAGAAAALVVISALVMTLGRDGADATNGPPSQAVATSGLPAKRGRGSFSSEPETKAELEPAGWQAAWDETDAQAKALLAEQRFGEAEKLYAALGERSDDLRLNRLIADAVAGVREQANAAYQAVEARARGLVEEKKFAEARSALDAFVNQHDVPSNVEAAKKLLADLDYRLLPISPCIGKASDGGDPGCRYTPEMIEVVQKTLQLEATGATEVQGGIVALDDPYGRGYAQW